MKLNRYIKNVLMGGVFTKKGFAVLLTQISLPCNTNSYRARLFQNEWHLLCTRLQNHVMGLSVLGWSHPLDYENAFDYVHERANSKGFACNQETGYDFVGTRTTLWSATSGLFDSIRTYY